MQKLVPTFFKDKPFHHEIVVLDFPMFCWFPVYILWFLCARGNSRHCQTLSGWAKSGHGETKIQKLGDGSNKYLLSELFHWKQNNLVGPLVHHWYNLQGRVILAQWKSVFLQFLLGSSAIFSCRCCRCWTRHLTLRHWRWYCGQDIVFVDRQVST